MSLTTFSLASAPGSRLIFFLTSKKDFESTARLMVRKLMLYRFLIINKIYNYTADVSGLRAIDAHLKLNDLTPARNERILQDLKIT